MRRLLGRFALGLAAVVTATGLASPAFAQASPSAHTSAVRYDAMDRVTGTIAPDPDGAGPLKYAATRTTYNSVGLPIKVETGELAGWHSEAVAPANWPTAAASPSTGFTVLSSVETSYDNVYRKVKVVTKGSDGVTTGLVQYSYNSAGRLECTAVRMNPAVYGSLPASACTLWTEGGFGPDRITRNVYDNAGQLIKVQKAQGTPLAEDYVTYSYTANGKQETVTDAKGHVATYAYDGFDRLAAWRFPSKANGTVSAACTIGTIAETSGVTGPSQSRTAGDDCEKYGYDRNGNRAFLVKRDGSVLSYQYDALNRNIVKTVPDCASPLCSGLAATHTRDVYFGYDLRGLQLHARFDSAAAGSDGLTTTYDGFGRTTSSALKMGAVTRSLGFVRDRNGNRTELTWPDAAKTSYAHDGLDRLIALRQGPLASGTTMASFYYTQRGSRDYWSTLANDHDVDAYDRAGRMTGLSHNYVGGTGTVSFSYGYTPGSQLASQSRDNDAYAWTGHYNVDRPYTVNGLNQYTAAGGASFCYDANGNLTADGGRIYRYDVENRLVEVRTQIGATCPDPAAGTGYSGALTAQLRYDPLGRLYETIGAATTSFLYDGDELVAEYSGAGTLLRRYAHGIGVDDPVLWYEGAGLTNPRSLHADHQGSIIGIATSAGTQFALNSYDEYGIPAATNQGRFQYTGQIWLPEVGMYYYKARIYSPTLGRFLQTDPIGYKDQVNLYAYVGSDPVNFADPDGLYKCTGSDKDCANLKVFMKNLGDAASKPEIGSRLGSTQLRAAYRFYGSDNRKGPEVKFEKVGGLAAAQFDGNNKVSIDSAKLDTAAADFANLNKLSRPVALGHVGAAVLAHEGAHGAFRVGRRFWDEVNAYETQARYYISFGLSDQSGNPVAVSGFSLPHRYNVGRRAMGSCTQSGTSSMSTHTECTADLNSYEGN